MARLYGAGWGLQSTTRLVSDTSGDMLMIDGDGDARLFTYDSYTKTYTTPAEDFGTLTLSSDPSLGYYLYTDQYDDQYYYDLNGRLTQIVQPNGWTTTYNYSGGLLSSVDTPDGGVTNFNYDAGLLSTIDEPGGRVVTLEHDGGGNLTEIIDAAGFDRFLSYNGGHLLTVDDWDPYDTIFDYSTLGLLDSLSQGPVNYSITSANSALLVNSNGQPLADMIDGVGDTTTYLLDTRGRVLKEIQPDGSSATWELDGTGNVVEYTDFDGLSTIYYYQDYGSYLYEDGGYVYQPASGDLLEVYYPNYTYESFAYDTLNEVTQYVDPDGDATVSQYDGEGELISETTGYGTPQAATTTYTWSDGLMQTMTDPDGNETVYAYAGFLLASQVVYNTLGEEESDDSYDYDAAGNLTRMVDSDGGITQYQYDGDNNQTLSVDPDGNTSSQVYDAAGFVIASTDGRGVETDYDYDGVGLPSAEVDAANTAQAETNTDAYNSAGEQTLGVDADGNSTSYAYNRDGYATLIVQALGTPQQGSIIEEYDEDGNVTLSVDPDGDTSSYAYDADGNLTLMIEGYGTGQ